MLGGHILHGGDYNPDQWLDHPEVLEEDVRLMKGSKCQLRESGDFCLGGAGAGRGKNMTLTGWNVSLTVSGKRRSRWCWRPLPGQCPTG